MQTDNVEPDISKVAATRFVYRAASGSAYDILGRPSPGDILRGTWVRYILMSTPKGETAPRYVAEFGLSLVWWATVPAGEDPLDRDDGLYWWCALRRFAIDQFLNSLDAAAVGSGPQVFVLKPEDRRDAVVRFCFRGCVHQASGSGEALSCSADVEGDFRTTLADCARCDMPDEWELCAHVTNVETSALKANEGWAGRQLLGALCQVGRNRQHPVPWACRGGAGTELPCFQPRVVASPALSASMPESDAEDLLTALNLEWNRVHGFPLFSFVVLEPLKHLRGECRDAGDGQRRIMAISQLLEALNADRLSGLLLPEALAALKATPGTLNLLNAVLTHSGYGCASTVIDSLRLVQSLRGMSAHSPDKGGERAVAAVKRLNQSFPIAREDWPAFWVRVRSTFTRALEELLAEVRSKGA